MLDQLRSLLAQGIKASQVAVIGPASLEKGSLARFREVGGVPLVANCAEWRRGAGLLVTTARAFKGLEADIVVLYDLSSFGKLFTTSDLYVAWTRARHRLICVCHGEEARSAVESALGARGA